MAGTITSSPLYESKELNSWFSNDRLIPRNSKWLQENVTDVDGKVKAIVKVIEEDAITFARKAEMYFKKRPELINLVEEFYRAYRALAERYNYTTGELRHARRTITEAFPIQVLFEMTDNSPSKSSAGERSSQKPEIPCPTNEFVDPNGVLRKKSEIQNLRKALADMHAEKEVALLEYQQTMRKLSDLEEEVNSAQMNYRGLSEQARKSETEVQRLKQAIVELEVERDGAFLQHKELIGRISNLEYTISQSREDTELNDRALRAESLSQDLKNKVSRAETEKNNALLQYKQCLEKISDLEKKISLGQEEARLLCKKAHRVETEVRKLKNDFSEMDEEKKAAAIQYEHCLVKISKLESELSCVEEEIRQVNSKALMETAKLKSAEERHAMLEMSNQSLQFEAINLKQRIAMKDGELSKKNDELEKHQAHFQDEHLRLVQVEAALQTLQDFYSLSQEEKGSLLLEIREVLRICKDLNISQHGLEEEEEVVTTSIEDLQCAIIRLKEIKEKLEEEVGQQKGLADLLQKQICHLKEDIKDLNKRDRALKDQINLVGLNPESIGSSIKDLQDENSKLRQIYEENKEAKAALSKKLDSVEQLLHKNANSKAKLEELQRSFQVLNGDKRALVSEKPDLLSQLQIITQSSEKVHNKNTMLDNPLYVANTELESLRGKSANLDDLCELLDNEKSNLLNEKCKLVESLNNAEQRLESLDKRFVKLEQKCARMEKEKESTLSHVEKLKVSLALENIENSSFTFSSEARLASLEYHINFLQEETRWRKKEFEEEVDKSVNSHFEIFLLKSLIKDLENENHSLLIEFEKHVESSELREKLVSELETENLEQRVEVELLLNEIQKLRVGIFEVFKALEISPDKESTMGCKLANVHHIVENIEDMKSCLSDYEEDRMKSLVENSVLLILLEQLRLEGAEIFSKKGTLEQKLRIMTEELIMVQNDNHECLEMSRQLKSDLNKEEQLVRTLKADMDRICGQQRDLNAAYLNLKEEHCQALGENKSLLKNFLDVKKDKHFLEEENDSILLETLVLNNLSTIFKNFGTEKEMELKLVSQDVQNLHVVNGNLDKEVGRLREKLEMEEMENLDLKDLVKKMESELHEVKDYNNQLRKEISDQRAKLSQKENDFSLSEENLEVMQDLNSELCRTVEELKSKHEESTLVKEKLEKEITELSEENENQRKEILFLQEVNGNLSSELEEMKKEFEDLNDQFRKEISAEKEILCLKEIELSLSEEKLKATEDLNSELYRTVEELKSKNEETILVKENLEKEITELSEGNENQRKEILFLQEVNGNLSSELEEMKNEFEDLNDQFRKKISAEKEILCLKEIELSLSEEKLKATEDLNLELCRTMEELKSKNEETILVKENLEKEITELSEENENQSKEILFLHEVNGNLSSELEEMKHEFEVWEAEASTFHFDLQNSMAHEVVFENKVHELTGVCKTLEHESASKIVETEKMKETIGFMESEIGCFKAQLFAYAPVIDSVRENMVSLEHQIISQPELDVVHSHDSKDVKEPVHLDEEICQKPTEEHISVIPNRIPELQDLQRRIKALEKVVTEEKERLAIERNTSNKLEPVIEQRKGLKEEMELKGELGDTTKFQKINPETFGHFEDVKQRREDRSLQIEKDLSVDKIEVSTVMKEPNSKHNGRRISEIVSNVHQLNNLQKTVQDLKRRLERNKKKKMRAVDFEMTKSQLKEVEKMLMHLVEVNGQMKIKPEEIPLNSDRNVGIEIDSEEAEREFEKIERLHMEVQKLENVVLKLENEKKSRGKNRFFKSRTSIIMKSFFPNGTISGIKRRKGLCRCLRSPANGER